MRRAPALVPLSHEHHQALEAALVLRRVTPAGEEAAIGRFLAFWSPMGQHHLEIEERVLLPAVEDLDAELTAACARVRTEHEQLRRLADRAGRGEATLADLRELGRLLHDHVRFEERKLFPLIEQRLAPGELSVLALQ